MFILETARLVLRTVDAADAPFYLDVVNDPDFLTHIGDRNIRTLAAAAAAIDAGPVKMQALLGFSIYLVERKDDARPVGMCGLIKRDTLDEVDIGYALLPPFRGHGYALEAAGAVVAYARRTVGLTRLLALAAPDNLRSQALLDKIGMRYQKMVRLGPEDSGTRLYAMAL